MPTHTVNPQRRQRARRVWRRRSAGMAVIIVVAGLLGSCSTLSYYSHLAAGEASVLAHRQSITRLIADPSTPAALRSRLQLAQRARAFASTALDLPRNRSYTTYTDIKRPYVMYNVFATPPLSLQPIQHCFPIAGCVAYQGFYKRNRAGAAAAKLRQAGDDVYIGGVPAYSTLGHFADPLLSSMNRWDDDQLVGTLFHELAHQKLYVKGDTPFNESFATFVQREGLRQWHAANHLPPTDPAVAQRRHQFTELVLATRKRLKTLYGSALPNSEKRQRKQIEFTRLRDKYRHLRDTQWHGNSDYDAWIDAPLNNAKLLPFGLYNQGVPAFAALFQDCHRQWNAFYDKVRTISRLPPARRAAFLSRKHPTTPL